MGHNCIAITTIVSRPKVPVISLVPSSAPRGDNFKYNKVYMKYVDDQHNVKGFTLIEVMVVITIVGLMASVVLAAMSTAREKARDAARVTAVKELQKALELYRNANGGLYPCSTASPACIAGGAQVNINGSAHNAVFDAAISPYLVSQDDAIIFTANPTWGSIVYRTGGTVNAPVRNSYTVMLRREQNAVKGDGTVINADAWCDIRVGPNTNTVNWPDGNYTDCF